MASVPESTFRILLILLTFSKLEDERGEKKNMPLLRSKVMHCPQSPVYSGLKAYLA